MEQAGRVLEERRSTPAAAPGRMRALVDRLAGALAAYLLFAAVCCFLNLGGPSLISMEAMVADGAARMLADGQWAVPHLYGELFTFKPALALWLSALAQRFVEQPGELALRLPFALAGALLGLALFLLLARSFGTRVGLLSAMAAVGSALFVEKVRIAEYDTPLAVAVGVAVAAALVNLAQRDDRLSLWLLAYLALAAGFVSKGVPALMVYGPGLLLAALLLGRVRRLFGWKHLLGAAFGVLLLGAYLWWALRSGGPRIFDQPLREAQLRGVRWGAAELLQTALEPALVWTVFLPWSLAFFLWRPFQRAADEPLRRLARGALGFVLGGVAAFALLPTSEARYYLPLAAPVALVAGPILAALWDRPVPAHLVLGCRGLFGLSAVAALGAAASRGTASWPLLAAAVAILALAAFRGPAAAGRSLVATLASLALLVAVGQALVTLPNRAARRSLEPAAARFASSLPDGESLWAFGPADCAGAIGPVFQYLGRPVRTLSSPASAPAGSYGILRSWQQELLPPEVVVQTVASDRSSPVELFLVRVVENRMGPPAEPPGPRVGDLCLCRFEGSRAPEPPRPAWLLEPGLVGAPEAPDPRTNLGCWGTFQRD